MNDEDELDAEEEAALARMREAEERVRTTPPGCLEGFKATPSRLKGVAIDGHGEPLNVVYRLACACGKKRFHALGHWVENEGHRVFVSPLALECVACGKVTELFDSDKHGYDPIAVGQSYSIRGTGQRTAFACDACGRAEMAAHARFEFSGETLEDSTGEFTGNEHNLFTWFTLAGECTACGRAQPIADFECA